MKKNKIGFIDTFVLGYYTFIKNFYYAYRENLKTYYISKAVSYELKRDKPKKYLSYFKTKEYYTNKIRKYLNKSDKHYKRLTLKYNVAKSNYDKYIAYLNYKMLHYGNKR